MVIQIPVCAGMTGGGGVTRWIPAFAGMRGVALRRLATFRVLDSRLRGNDGWGGGKSYIPTGKQLLSHGPLMLLFHGPANSIEQDVRINEAHRGYTVHHEAGDPTH